MMGGDIENDSTKGMIPRLVSAFFDKIRNAPAEIEFTVSVSFLEIYMEKIRDLLNRIIDFLKLASNDNLPIHEEKIKGIFIKGLKEVYVASFTEVMEVMRIGESFRSVAATSKHCFNQRYE